jgi:hypothetical protein
MLKSFCPYAKTALVNYLPPINHASVALSYLSLGQIWRFPNSYDFALRLFAQTETMPRLAHRE